MRVYRVDIQEVTERSGLVTAASEDAVQAALEDRGYSLFDEDVQVSTATPVEPCDASILRTVSWPG